MISGARLLIAYIAIALRGRYAIGIFSQSISLVIPTQYVLTKAQEANGDRCVIAGVGEAVRLCAMLTRSCYVSYNVSLVQNTTYLWIWVVKWTKQWEVTTTFRLNINFVLIPQSMWTITNCDVGVFHKICFPIYWTPWFSTSGVCYRRAR